MKRADDVERLPVGTLMGATERSSLKDKELRTSSISWGM